MKAVANSAVLLFAMVWSNFAFCGEIHDAARAGDLYKVKALLKANPDLVSSKDENGATPLHIAAALKHEATLGYLLANKADVNAKDKNGQTPAEIAVNKGYDNVAKMLLPIGSSAMSGSDSDLMNKYIVLAGQCDDGLATKLYNHREGDKYEVPAEKRLGLYNSIKILSAVARTQFVATDKIQFQNPNNKNPDTLRETAQYIIHSHPTGCLKIVLEQFV